MSKIMNAYENMQLKPVIEITKNAFKIILPNRNVEYEAKKEAAKTESDTQNVVNTGKRHNNGEEKILQYVRTHGSITKNDVIDLLEVSASTASRTLRKMVKANLLQQNGKARNTYYTSV